MEPSTKAVRLATVVFGLTVGLLASCALAARPTIGQTTSPSGRTTGDLLEVTSFTGPMPTGVTMSQEGCVFVTFPRWGGPMVFTVAEAVNGAPVAYPDAAITAHNLENTADTFV